MAVDFANMRMEGVSEQERDAMIVGLGKRYRFGVLRGEDGRERWCVDYDEDDEESSQGGVGEREVWLQDKVARPVAVRLSLE